MENASVPIEWLKELIKTANKVENPIIKYDSDHDRYYFESPTEIGELLGLIKAGGIFINIK